MDTDFRLIGAGGLILLCALAVFRCEPADPAGPLLSDLPDNLWRQRYPRLHDRLPEETRHHDSR